MAAGGQASGRLDAALSLETTAAAAGAQCTTTP